MLISFDGIDFLIEFELCEVFVCVLWCFVVCGIWLVVVFEFEFYLFVV